LTISKNIGTENIFNSLKNGTISLMSEKQIVIKFWKKQNQKKKVKNEVE
jgi:hypothetical protein